MVQGRCMKCKAQVDIQNPVEGVTAKGGKIVKGSCGACGTTVCRMGALN